MRYVTVKVTRDTNHSHAGDVAPWEIPILELIHDSGNVTELGDVTVDRDPPEAHDEYVRLESRYGRDVEKGMSYVAQIYGQAGAGVRALQAAIEKESAAIARPATADADDLAA
jgi:hypothetical protein